MKHKPCKMELKIEGAMRRTLKKTGVPVSSAIHWEGYSGNPGNEKYSPCKIPSIRIVFKQ